jgi:geranylgeranyl pyrophosphate synthase
MWSGKKAELLKYEIETCFTPLSDVSNLYNLIKEPLIQSKKENGIESTYNNYWSLLPLIVCEAITGRYEHALPAAASLQLFKAAAEVFDDIEDADSSMSLSARYGSAIATNIATTLIILAEKTITRLKKNGIEDSVIIQMIDLINSFYTTSCIGQHLDLSLSPDTTVTEETYLKITDMKSASTVECGCHVGALLATTNQQLIATFANFGHNLGMAGQIANDIQGIMQGSDIVKRKITLPIIYALTQTDSKTINKIRSTFGNSSERTPDVNGIRDLLFNSGAINYAMIKVELFKQLALDNLSEVENAGAKVGELKLFFQQI